MSRRIGALTAALTLAASPLVVSGCAGVLTAWQNASNRDMTHRIAPVLTSTAWIHPDGAAPAVAYGGRWTLLAFLDLRSRATLDELPALCTAQETYRADGLVVFAVTEADLETTSFFLESHPVTFSVLAAARDDRIAFGIKKLYEPVVYLVDPYQRVLAAGLGPSLVMLKETYGH